MLSSRAKYALRALVHLARCNPAQGWTLASAISQAERIPRKFLEAILVELRDNGFIESRRGRYGGYRLARPAGEICAGSVIRVVDGPLALAPCASRTRFAACEDCLDHASCALHPLLRAARDAVAHVLDSCSLAELAMPATLPLEPAQ
jgi:Rrf2 family protein